MALRDAMEDKPAWFRQTVSMVLLVAAVTIAMTLAYADRNSGIDADIQANAKDIKALKDDLAEFKAAQSQMSRDVGSIKTEQAVITTELKNLNKWLRTRSDDD